MISNHLVILQRVLDVVTPARLFKLSPGVAFALAAVIPIPATAASYALPTQCSAAAVCSPVGGGSITQFATSGRASFGIQGNTGFVWQQDSKAIVNWKDFNVGSQNTLRYVRVDENGNPIAGASFSTLNRIYQGSASVIEGKIEVQDGQNGAIYLINQNGILFKGTAQVDVNTLVASALNIKDDDFMHPDGLLHPYIDGKRPAFFWDGDAAGFQDSLIQVNAGATLTARLGGAIMLFAPKVLNQGTIQTTEGQTILASGGSVYLTAPPDNSNWSADSPYRGLAGLLVEVDPHAYDPVSKVQKDDMCAATAGSGTCTVTNSAKNPVLKEDGTPVIKEDGTVEEKIGEIIANRGNVSLAALAINQLGRVSATTAVAQKGSIRLLARQGITEVDNGAGVKTISGKQAGTLTLGDDSETTITPDAATAGQTVTDDQTFDASTLEAVGNQIVVGDRAKVLVPGGYIDFAAQVDGSLFQEPNRPANASRIYLGKGSEISVAGVSGVDVSVERYFVQVDLRGTELKDDPLNRDGVIRGKKVWVDLRNLPDASFADLSAYQNTIGRTVAEKLSTGGNISFRSEGDIVQRVGSAIDVSGGTLNTLGGIGNTSRLLSNGAVIDIANAKGDRVYDNILDQYTVTDPKWGVSKIFNLPLNRKYYAGYVEGKDAGAITFVSHALALDGDLKGSVTTGPYQRDAAPHPGQLVIGDASKGAKDVGDYKIPAVTILNSFNPLAGFDAASVLPQPRIDTTLISADMLNRSGLGKVAIYSNGEIKIEAGSNLSLPAFGELALTGGKISVNDSVAITAGSIALSTRTTQTTIDYAQTNIDIAPGVTLSTAGEWINDKLNGPNLSQTLKPREDYDSDGKLIARGSGQHIWDGGTVSLQSAGYLNLDQGSLVDVSGSGYLDAKGKLFAGNAGTITLATNVGQPGTQQIAAPLTMKGQLRAFAPGQGGTLNITVPALTLGSTGRGQAGEFLLTPEFFNGKGFANYTLQGRDSVVVQSNSVIAPLVSSLLLNRAYEFSATGSDLRQFSSVWIKPEFQRQGTNLTLAATQGGLTLEKGATLQVGPRGKIALSAAAAALDVEGTVVAPGGITLSMAAGAKPGDPGDVGYDPNQVIWIGKDARLSAIGAVINTPNAAGLRTGEVLDSGNIVINANKGYVVAEKGAVLDVSGVAATFDLPALGASNNTIQAQTVAGNAGSIAINAREGALLDATLLGKSSGARGGTLALTLDRQGAEPTQYYPGSGGLNGFGINDPNRQWKIVLTQSQDSVPLGLKVGDNIDLQVPGRMNFAVDRALQGGFEQLAFNGEHGVLFKGDVALQTAQGLRSLTVNAPIIESDGGQVKLDAAYVNLGQLSTIALRQTAQTASAGNGQLSVSANQVDLSGHFALRGFKATAKSNDDVAPVTIESKGDVRFVGVVKDDLIADGILNDTKRPEGSFTLASDLAIKARQVYASTLSAYNVSAPGRVIQIAGNGTPTPVLSAASDLSFNAASIKLAGLKAGDAGGVIKAPFGSVSLTADEIVLDEGSVVSVSGENQLVPFGRTELTGQDYLYDLGAANRIVDTPPEKRIVLTGKTVTFDAASKLDVSGGGDLLAYEWINGLGGSKDVLSPGQSPNTFAILPALRNGFAPFDSQIQGELLNAGVQSPMPGSVVYLTGVRDLKDGYYTLLPARYGLLPDARLVTVAGSSYQDLLPTQNVATIAGGQIVSGYFAAANRDGSTYTQTSRTQGFVVEPNTIAKSRSEYLQTTASKYFAASGYQLPGDAGGVVFNASSALSLLGNLVAKRQAGYRGAEVDITAPKLAVVSDGGESLGAEDSDAVKLDADTLTALGAESLLLGGIRSQRADGLDVEVLANKVIIANKLAVDTDGKTLHQLSAPEIILAATGKLAETGQVLLKKDSYISGEGAVKSRGETLNITNANGDGALLRVSGGGQVVVSRNMAPGASGDLVQESGSVVHAGGALNLDATRSNTLGGSLDLDSAAGLALSSSGVSIGGGDTGLKFDLTAFKALLKKTGDLRLRSYSTIDFYGSLDMGQILGLNTKNPLPVPNLRLEAQGIVGHATTEFTNPEVILYGDQVVLANPIGGSITPTLGTGSLTINARELHTGKGNFAVSGYSKTSLKADTQIIADAEGSLHTPGPLELTAPRITGSTVSKYAFKSNAALTISTPANLDVRALTKSVPGAELTFEGQSVSFAGSSLTAADGTKVRGLVDLPGGKIIVNATGGDITLDGGALRAAGNEEYLFDAPVGQPGGLVQLTATGKVDIKSESLVDVSAVGADAGTLSIVAKTLDIGGELLGGSKVGAEGATGNQGRFDLDVGALADLSPLAAKLGTGNFTDSARIRVRTGDTQLASGTLTARDIQISADAGSVTIGGTLDASSANGGSIALSADKDVSLTKDAILMAKALNTAGHGGRVEIATVNGNLDLKSGSKIDVSGDGAARGGEVWLRAGVKDDKKTIKYTALDSTVTGATYVDSNGAIKTAAYLEAFDSKTYAYDTGTQTINTDISSAIAKFYDDLTKPVSVFRVVPGVEISNKGGDLVLSSDWNLGSNTWRYGADKEAGVLTLRAKGDVNFNGVLNKDGTVLYNPASLSDGFNSATATGAYSTTLPNTWAYRIVAGSDFSAAAPLAVGTSGNVTIGAGKIVRTGAGFIDIAAGGNIELKGTATSAATIYTAGRPGPAVAGFTSTYPRSSQIPAYPMGGGDIRLFAGGNIIGKNVVVSGEPIINQWLYRLAKVGATDPLTTWWPRFDKFKQGVATLGGGDISVEAKGDIESLWLSAATNGRLEAGTGRLVVQGGGDIRERAGGNISDGLLFIAQGKGEAIAGGALASRVALMDGSVHLSALRNATVLDAFNPTAYLQNSNNSNASAIVNGALVAFNSYAEGAGLNLLSRAGDAILQSDYAKTDGVAYPSRLYAVAPRGNVAVQVSNPLVLYPDPRGDLSLLAGKDVTFNNTLVMSDYARSAIPSIAHPGKSLSGVDLAEPEFGNNALSHDPSLLHVNDSVISRIYAGDGDVASTTSNRALVLAKPAKVQAGHDVVDLYALFQNLADSDVSLVSAGNDVRYETKRDTNTGAIQSQNSRIEVSGPGRLEVISGRDIDLGSSYGLLSVGNAYNPYLSDSGSSIAVMTGLGSAENGSAREPAYQAFRTKYLNLDLKDPLNPKPTQAMKDFEASLQYLARKEVRAQLKYDAELHGQKLSDKDLDLLLDTTNADLVVQRKNDLLATFNAQPLAVQVRRVFFNELLVSGKEWTDTGDATRGTSAASVLFPENNYAGNLNLFFSQIKTEHGGDIELIVPGGLINAGLASSGAIAKAASDLGIVAIGKGDVRAYVRDDIQVNQSRIFTLGGGDLVLWSDQGNIDAGKGAKSIRSAPAPRLVVKKGQVTFDVSGSVSGSGIAVLDTVKGAASGDTYLVAPNGEVSAGDAGIRASGNLLIAAQRVVGADNIQVGGASTGVPVASTGGLTGALNGSNSGDASNATDTITKSVRDSAAEQDKAIRESLASFRPSFISVEVVGFGADGQSSN